jgi:hypothetical protein
MLGAAVGDVRDIDNTGIQLCSLLVRKHHGCQDVFIYLVIIGTMYGHTEVRMEREGMLEERK